MRAVRIEAGRGLDGLALHEVEAPGDPGPGEIRVRVRASSLNYHDLAVCRSGAARLQGRTPLSDGAGEVEAVGAGVTEFREGDAVVSTFFPTWQDGAATLDDFTTVPGDGADGFAQEIVVRPATAFTHAPAGYGHPEAATLTTAGLTAWRALVEDGRLRAGEVVLTLGTGGVSVFALQIAKAMGAEVVSTSSSDEKLARMRALGADHTINYRSTPDWGEEVMRLTGGRGADHVVEVGGPGTLPQSIAAVRNGGRIHLIGVLTGRGGEVPTARLMAKQARLQGVIVGSRRMQRDFVRGLEVAGVRPVVDRTFPLSDLADAFRHEEAGRHFGKIAIEV